jgi:hypothetical protein
LPVRPASDPAGVPPVAFCAAFPAARFVPRVLALVAAGVTFAGLLAGFFAGVFAAFLAFDERFTGAFFAAFRPVAPRAGVRPGALRAAVLAVFALFFPAADFRGADFFAPDFFLAVFAAAFFAGRRADFFAAAFFAGALFAVRDAFFAGALRAGFLAADFFAGLFLAGAFLPPAFFAVALREDFPAFVFAAAFDDAFFTLFFPAAFLVVLLAFFDAFADRAFFLVPAGFLPASFFDAAFRPAVFPAFFFVAAFRPVVFPAFFFVAAFFVAAFRPAAVFLAVVLRADDFLPEARVRLVLAAGGRTVATRAVRGVISSGCPACPVFDLAFEAMLSSRNAGARTADWFSWLTPLEHVRDVLHGFGSIEIHRVSAAAPDRCRAVLTALVHGVEFDIEIRAPVLVQKARLDRPADDSPACLQTGVRRGRSRPHRLDHRVGSARLDHRLAAPRRAGRPDIVVRVQARADDR